MKELLKRFKSPVVISGIFTIIIVVSGISPENMTSWGLLFDNIIAIFKNPFVLISIVWQVIAFLNNPIDKENW